MKFKLRRTANETDAEVMFDSLDELGTALDSLREMIRSVKIEDAKRSAHVFWEQTDGVKQVIASIEDSGERIAISLLDRWPDSVRNADIVLDTGLSRAGVYDNLTGRRGDKGNWFRSDNEMYILSETGEEEVIKFVFERLNPGE